MVDNTVIKGKSEEDSFERHHDMKVNVNGSIATVIQDAGGIPAEVDNSTHSLQIIEYEHHEIHSGSFYRIHINKDVANGGTFSICFTTPNTTKWPHMTFGIEVEVEAQTELVECITSWTGGTPLTPINANRNSTNTSGIINMVQDATITRGTPVVLDKRVLGSGKNQGGGARANNEWVLKQNTTYCLVVTNQALGSDNEINIDLEWYEHTDKN